MDSFCRQNGNGYGVHAFNAIRIIEMFRIYSLNGGSFINAEPHDLYRPLNILTIIIKSLETGLSKLQFEGDFITMTA